MRMVRIIVVIKKGIENWKSLVKRQGPVRITRNKRKVEQTTRTPLAKLYREAKNVIYKAIQKASKK